MDLAATSSEDEGANSHGAAALLRQMRTSGSLCVRQGAFFTPSFDERTMTGPAVHP